MHFPLIKLNQKVVILRVQPFCQGQQFQRQFRAVNLDMRTKSDFAPAFILIDHAAQNGTCTAGMFALCPAVDDFQR